MSAIHDSSKFKELLDGHYTWPDYYTFKFIIRPHQKQDFIDLLPGVDVVFKESGKGSYLSVTFRKLVQSSDEVITVYALLSKLPGVMSL